MSEVIHVSQDNWQQEVIQSQVPVLVDFWAPWCGPCKKIAPVLDQVAAEVGDKAKVVKVNVDENQLLATMYQVMSIPNLKFFVNGEPAAELVGAGVSKTQLVGKLAELG